MIPLVGGPFDGGFVSVPLGSPYEPEVTLYVSDDPSKYSYLLCGEDGRVWYSFVERSAT